MDCENRRWFPAGREVVRCSVRMVDGHDEKCPALAKIGLERGTQVQNS